MRALIFAAGLALAACQPQAPDGTTAEPPADAPAAAAPAPTASVTDFSGPMIARGNEPFWAVKMEGTKFTLQRPDHADLAFAAPGARITPGQGVWTAKATDGQTLTVTLYVSDCSDGMSDLKYPFAAEVAYAGQTFRGCAVKLADLPRGGDRP